MLDYSVPIISGRKVKEENQTLVFKKKKEKRKKNIYINIYMHFKLQVCGTDLFAVAV